MPTIIREFLPSDYDAVIALWRSAPGVSLRDDDAREPVCAYLARNRGLSFVAEENGAIVGAMLCGTDGRRGYLQHMAVVAEHRGRGVGRRLAEAGIAALRARGIQKCHLMVLADNEAALSFWSHIGWLERGDIQLMSYTTASLARTVEHDNYRTADT